LEIIEGMFSRYKKIMVEPIDNNPRSFNAEVEKSTKSYSAIDVK